MIHRASYAAYAEAFGIFAKHEPDEKYGLCAEHDSIWAGSDIEIPEEDVTRLENLGWFFDEHIGRWCLYV